MTRCLICAVPVYLDVRPTLKETEDLSRHKCIFFTRLVTHPIWHLQYDGKGCAIKVGGRLEMDDAQAVIQVAVAGARG
ncbi:MAG: hypothetical protein VB142_02130 [Burkholderia sp.]